LRIDDVNTRRRRAERRTACSSAAVRVPVIGCGAGADRESREAGALRRS
jgi:hypothetical protein